MIVHETQPPVDKLPQVPLRPSMKNRIPEAVKATKIQNVTLLTKHYNRPNLYSPTKVQRHPIFF